MLDAGVRPGDRIAILLPNVSWMAVAYIAAWKTGTIPMPLNPNLTSRELLHSFRAAEPTAIIAGSDRLAVAREAARNLDGLVVRAWFTDRAVDPSVPTLGSLPPARGEVWADDPGEVAAILFTSATSGQPKGVMLRHQGILFVIERLLKIAPIAGQTTYCGLPLFHVYSMVLVLLAYLLGDGCIVLEPGFQYPHFLEVMARERVSTVQLVPPVLQLMLMRSDAIARYDLSALRHIYCGAAPLSRKLAERAEMVLGCYIYEGYGITETSPLVALPPVGRPIRHGSVGPPLEGVTIEIRDATGRKLPSGQQGEIWVRTPGLMKGYFRDDAETTRVVVDGWFLTGDIGWMDADGYVYVTDRVKDVIFVGGLNVYPHEVEEVISDFPGVGRVAVVPMRNEATGEVPQAYVVPQPGTRIEVPSLLAFVRARLAPYKQPKRIQLVAELPISPTGKIQRYRLRDAP